MIEYTDDHNPYSEKVRQFDYDWTNSLGIIQKKKPARGAPRVPPGGNRIKTD